MKVIKVPNLLTTDQKVGGSSPSKRTYAPKLNSDEDGAKYKSGPL
jgi:hypothetical protein